MIELRDLCMTFNPGDDGEKHALKNVNLAIRQGRWCNLLGPNGSGKSTLLKLLAGELQPTRGDVLVNGHSILAESAHRRARTFFFVEQDSRANLVSSMTIEENLLLALCSSRFPGLGWARRRARREMVAGALQQLGMGLEKRLTAQVRLLSGGERQAVVIAKALIMASPVLLLDEFLAAMDPQVGPSLLRAVRRLALARGLTVVSVTHNLQDHILNREEDDQVVLLRQGELIFNNDDGQGNTREFTMDWLLEQYSHVPV